MRVVGISCSPRSNSNSSILLENCLDALKDDLVNINHIKLKKLNFSLCSGCESCSSTGQCIFNDELVSLIEEVLEADKVIIAAPVFGMGINALGKAMIDRTQVLWARQYVLGTLNHEHRKDGYLISTAGTTYKGVFDCAIKSVEYFFHVTGFKMSDTLLINPVDKPGEINGMKAYLDKAADLVKL